MPANGMHQKENEQEAMTNANSVADRMDLEQIRVYLQEHYGIPIVLRQQGMTSIKCLFCLKMHDHGPQPGHHMEGCNDDDRCIGIGIVIGERYFILNYGYTLFEYKEGADGVNDLLVDYYNYQGSVKG